MMDTQRLILLFIFGFSLLMLWESWERMHQPKLPTTASAPAIPKSSAPSEPSRNASARASASVPASAASLKGEAVRVSTDLVQAELSTLGATLKHLELLRHKDSNDPNKNFILLGAAHQYEAQSGLTGPEGPNHRTLWQLEPGERSLRE